MSIPIFLLHFSSNNRIRFQRIWFYIIFSYLLLLQSCTTISPTPLQPTSFVSIPTEPTNRFSSLPSTKQLIPETLESSPQPRVPGLETSWYTHPNGYFTLLAPRWTVDNHEYSVSFTDPSGQTVFTALVINVGYSIERNSFERFIHARETNLFGSYRTDTEINAQKQTEDGFVTVSKTLPLDGNLEQEAELIQTAYRQIDQAVLIVEILTTSEYYAASQDFFSKIRASVSIDPQAVATIPAYISDHPFIYSNDYNSLSVPDSWEIHLTIGENTRVDTLYSPDEQAVVQFIQYDDGLPLVGTEAGTFALSLLNTYYARDIRVTSDQVLSRSRECLSWFSESGDYQGLSCFETRGTAFLLFTTMYQNAYQDVYAEVLKIISNSLVPVSEDGLSNR